MTAQALIQNHLGMVFAEANQIAKSDHAEFGEYVTAGFVGLHKAALRFDPTLGWKFSSYASRRIKGEILDQRRLEFGRKGRGHKKIHQRRNMTLDKAGFLSTRFVDTLEQRDSLDALIEGLSGRYRMTARMLAEGFTVKEIAPAVGMCDSMIHLDINRVIKPHLESRIKRRTAIERFLAKEPVSAKEFFKWNRHQNRRRTTTRKRWYEEHRTQRIYTKYGKVCAELYKRKEKEKENT